MSLKHAVDEASYRLQQVALLFECAPVGTDTDMLSSPIPASSRSPMSSVIHSDATWTAAVTSVQVGC